MSGKWICSKTMGSTSEGPICSFHWPTLREVIEVRADWPLQSKSRAGLITGRDGGDDISHR